MLEFRNPLQFSKKVFNHLRLFFFLSYHIINLVNKYHFGWKMDLKKYVFDSICNGYK